jgi:4-diphosphocytidyl-2C-methyl-D-erythritol kinase
VIRALECLRYGPDKARGRTGQTHSRRPAWGRFERRRYGWRLPIAWNLNWPRAWSAVAAEIGSDVPFFSRRPGDLPGRGEVIEPLELGAARLRQQRPRRAFHGRVYRGCRLAASPAHAPLVELAAATPPAPVAVQSLGRAAAVITVGRTITERACPADCVGHWMSGSGSSYFGICRYAMLAVVATAHTRCRVYVARVVARPPRQEKGQEITEVRSS